MDLLDGLDPAQLAAVTNPTDPVGVLARAGTGKTRVLSRRIAWRADQGTLDIRRVLAITFTTRAARELRDRLADLVGRDTGTTGTFHAIAWRMVRDHHTDTGSTPPTILENPRGLLVAQIPDRHRGATPAIVTAVTRAAAHGHTPDTLRADPGDGDMPDAPPAGVVADVLAAYTTAKRRRGVVDFDDLISECVALFDTDPAFAAAQRWRFRHFFVDEYQDVNPLQQRLLDAWTGGRDDLFVVGDPNQAIYGFNGADAGHLTDFAHRHPNATIIELTTNHRSVPGIVTAADAVFSPGPPTTHTPGSSACRVTACGDDEREAITIARALRAEHVPGRRWAAQAVLVRTNAQARAIGEVLTRAGIPVLGAEDPAGSDGVRVLSFHSAKGLEWPVVHVAGVEEGYVPDSHARTDAALSEERRLLYVAITRATRRVHLTWARRRTFGDRVVERSPSRWLPGVAATTGPTPGHRPTRRPAPVAPSRTDPATAVTPAQASRERLVAWRASTARAAAVPVAVVLSDAVLDDLVRLAPGDPEMLSRVPGLGTIKARRYGPALLDALHPGRTS